MVWAVVRLKRWRDGGSGEDTPGLTLLVLSSEVGIDTASLFCLRQAIAARLVLRGVHSSNVAELLHSPGRLQLCGGPLSLSHRPRVVDVGHWSIWVMPRYSDSAASPRAKLANITARGLQKIAGAKHSRERTKQMVR